MMLQRCNPAIAHFEREALVVVIFNIELAVFGPIPHRGPVKGIAFHIEHRMLGGQLIAPDLRVWGRLPFSIGAVFDGILNIYAVLTSPKDISLRDGDTVA